MGEFAYRERNSNLPSTQTYSPLYNAMILLLRGKVCFVIHIFEKKKYLNLYVNFFVFISFR